MKTTHPSTVEDGVVVTLEYTVKVAGETVDTSEGHEPIQFIQGMGMVIDGLEPRFVRPERRGAQAVCRSARRWLRRDRPGRHCPGAAQRVSPGDSLTARGRADA